MSSGWSSFLKNINWSPNEYAESAVIAREAAEELLSRLDWLTIAPNVIVDMGCGLGEWSARLQARYPTAKVIALDNAMAMNEYARGQSLSTLCADAGKLPFANASVDLIFANLILPWNVDAKALLQEWRRVLAPGGVIMLTALGLSTLQECRTLFNPDDAPIFLDMHDYGDMLLELGFADPVLDVAQYTLTYRNKEKLASELYTTGMLASTINADSLAELPANEDGIYQATYEVIFAHAFMPAQTNMFAPEPDGTVRIPISALRQSTK